MHIHMYICTVQLRKRGSLIKHQCFHSQPPPHKSLSHQPALVTNASAAGLFSSDKLQHLQASVVNKRHVYT